MNGICGWLGECEYEESPTLVLKRMAREFTEPEVGGQHSKAATGAGLCVQDGHFYADDDLWAAIEGNPFWSSPDVADVADSHGPAEALAFAYRRHGSDLLKHLRGPFSLAVFNVAESKAMLAIDRMGVRPLFYAAARRWVAFGSTTTSLKAHPSVTSTVSAQAVFDYVYFHVVPGPETIFEEQKKLLPGQYVEFDAGRAKTVFYWEPVFREDAKASVKELSSTLRELLWAAVRRCGPDAKTGSFLSGGVDSSTISGIMSHVNRNRARTYSIGFDVDAYDEVSYARVAADHFGLEQNVYYVGPQDLVYSVPKIAQFYDEPFGNSSAIAVYCCARMAKEDGIRLMLAGDGGDELFAGHIRYARQKILELYSSMPSGFRDYFIEPVLFGFPHGEQIMPVRKARNYVRYARTDLPERRELYNSLRGRALGEVYQHDFLSSVNRHNPLLLLREVYGKTEGEDVLNRLLHLDWKFTLADNDLRKVNRMCELAGVSVRYPMLDDELVEFSTGIPPGLKLKGLKLRSFFKYAMKDFLPRQILVKPKKGFGLPFEVWLRSCPPLRELAYDSIQDLKKRLYFQKSFLESLVDCDNSESDRTRKEILWSPVLRRLIQQSKTGHPPPSAEMVWVLMMLELWLQKHEIP
ncbi:MAG TPA: asparagine synthase-related protein [Blastocatellia bacterium]|nr:asparagine synthase-related protein [Blastocatellia bacterium]